MNLADRARAYLEKLPVAVSGQGGHAATFNAACRIVSFGVSQDEAWSLLIEWNQRCQPPWSESDLRHKLTDAFRRVSLRADLHDQPRSDFRSDTPESKRARWPRLEVPCTGELAALGELRNLSTDGLKLAVDRGLLWSCWFRGHRCWVVTDSRRLNAQARRLDGQPFPADSPHGKPVKALTLPGSIASLPVGLPEASAFTVLLLAEGGPDMLAAFHFIDAEDRGGDCSAVALLGSSLRIPDSTLPSFAGKRVRVFPHADQSGRSGAARWVHALRPVVANIDGLNFAGFRRLDGQPVNDLNDLTQIDPDDFETHRDLWNLCPTIPHELHP